MKKIEDNLDVKLNLKMSSRKKQKKPVVEESSDDDLVENPPSKPDDDWLKNTPSRPNFFDTLSDSDDAMADLDEEDISIDNVVASAPSNYSNLLQFITKQNDEVRKELAESKNLDLN